MPVAAAVARRVRTIAAHASSAKLAARSLVRSYQLAAAPFGTDLPKFGIRALIVGPPGSGKGTLSARLVRDFNFQTIASGDSFRDQISRGTALGRAANFYIKKGELVPDDVTCDLMLDSICSAKADNVLLDGFPRTHAQAEEVDKVTSIDMVLHLDVPDEVIVQRMTQRRFHIPSGRVYHLEFNPPRVDGKDDVTGEPLVIRDDDKPETVLHRLEVYHAETEAIIQHYTDKGVVETFKGTESNEIYPRMQAYVKGFSRGMHHHHQ